MAISTKSNILSVDEFLTDLVAFAVANAGFTDNGTDGAGTETLYRISKTTDTVLTYWGLRLNTIVSTVYSETRVQSRMMLSLPTDANFDTLAEGQRYKTAMGLFDIAPTFTGYSFFTDGTAVFAVLEVTSGVFAHMSFGDITKAGVWSGGAFLTANNYQFVTSTGLWRPIIEGSHNSAPQIFGARQVLGNSDAVGPSYIRYNIGGSDHTDFTKLGGRDHTSDGSLVGASGFMSPNYNTGRLISSTSFVTDLYAQMMLASPSVSTFRAPLFPIIMGVQSFADIGQWHVVGHIPNITCVNIKLLDPKELVNTDWRVFPLAYKGIDSSLATLSDVYGVAYREIP